MYPKHDYILIELDETSNESTHMVDGPDGEQVALPVVTFQESGLLTATVLAVGPGRTSPNGVLIPVKLEEGDKVYLQPYSAFLATKDRNVKLVRYDDVVAVG